MRLTEQAHHILQDTVHECDTVIDATAGNGHDTVHLARLVGPKGRVIAIDIQASAIESTRCRLEATNAAGQSELIQGDHARVLHDLLRKLAGATTAITFNLGYLPGSDKSLTTDSATTLQALDAALQLLHRRGVLLVTAYRGHKGGMTEASAVESWMRELADTAWSVEAREPAQKTTRRIPPILWIVRRKLNPVTPGNISADVN
jgi:tRNA G37 N-methylase Trm5